MLTFQSKYSIFFAIIMQNELKEYSLFYITAPIGKPAEHIAQELLKNNLAACINILPAVDSYFWWNDKIDHEQECLLIGKTEKNLCRIYIGIGTENTSL